MDTRTIVAVTLIAAGVVGTTVLNAEDKIPGANKETKATDSAKKTAVATSTTSTQKTSAAKTDDQCTFKTATDDKCTSEIPKKKK